MVQVDDVSIKKFNAGATESLIFTWKVVYKTIS